MTKSGAGGNVAAVLSRAPSVCPDCPATRNRVLGELVGGGRHRCAFRCRFVAARQPLPPRWFGGYGLALVRRGIVIRQRVDADGAAIAVDAVGPGGATPLSEGGDTSSAGYAVDDVLLCLCPRRRLREAVDAGAPTSAQVLSLHTAALDRVERIAQARSRPATIARVAALRACSRIRSRRPGGSRACPPACNSAIWRRCSRCVTSRCAVPCSRSRAEAWPSEPATAYAFWIEPGSSAAR